jgi:4-hydroxybenzoate polyprenyltransferase
MLTATTVFLPALYEWQIFKLYTSIIIYCIVFFAFLLTLMREIVKDIEDIKGDATDGCSTLPIVMGVQFCKYLLYGLTLLFIAFMAFVGYKSITTFAWLNVFAILLLPMIGMVIFSIKLKKAYLQKHFKWLSSLLKIITFLGIIQIYFI